MFKFRIIKETRDGYLVHMSKSTQNPTIRMHNMLREFEELLLDDTMFKVQN